MINWDEAPDWAKFAAMDANGEWFFYESEPSVDYEHWAVDDESMRFKKAKYEAVGWKQSLTKKPKESK